MALDFTAIDFETANSYRGSPCSVGMVKVRDGRIVDESMVITGKAAKASVSQTLMQRPSGFDR